MSLSASRLHEEFEGRKNSVNGKYELYQKEPEEDATANNNNRWNENDSLLIIKWNLSKAGTLGADIIVRFRQPSAVVFLGLRNFVHQIDIFG